MQVVTDPNVSLGELARMAKQQGCYVKVMTDGDEPYAVMVPDTNEDEYVPMFLRRQA